MFNNPGLFLDAIVDYGMIMLDEAGMIQSLNKAAETMTEYGSGELTGNHFDTLYAAGEKERCVDEMAIALHTGRFSNESWKLKKDGSRFWCIQSITPVNNQDHEFTGYAIVIKDNTSKKEWELQVRNRNERYRFMVDGVKDYSIFMLDTTGHILTWNDGGKNIQGYSTNEVIGKHFSVFYNKEDIDNGKPDRELEIAKKEGKYEEEGWRVHKNRSLYWASVMITPLFDDNNVFIGFSKVTRDLSERNKQMELLRQSEERYKMLIEQVKDYGIFMLDEKGRIISWNEGAQRIKGYRSEEILGKYFSIFYPEEDKRNERPAFELHVAREKGRYEEEGWRIKKDGSKFWANVVITAIHNAQNQLIGYSKVTRDLTEHRQQEIALKESGIKYRQLAAQLTIVNKDLADANKELEDFTSMVSHDLQEPIRTTKSFLVVLEKKLAQPELNPAELDTYIQKAIKATDRMKALIVNLLQYAQLSQQPMQRESIDVVDLLNEIFQNLDIVIESTAAIIHVQAQARFVMGDRIQLVQLIQNLLSNSLKFTADEKPEISIHCSNETDKVLFSIADNGIGISKDNQHKVFDIFRREHTQKKYPGTGIGLAICRKIVERFKGEIWVDSTPGKGTTFFFTLNDNNVIP